MKSYMEMADAVFRRRDAYEKKKRRFKKRIQYIIGVGASCLLLGILCAAPWQDIPPGSQQPTELFAPEQTQSETETTLIAETEASAPEETKPSCVLLLANDTGSAVEETVLQANISLPLGYTITVTDLRGMDSGDARMLYHQLNRELTEKLTPDTFSSAGITRGANIALTITKRGCFKLDIADKTAVASIDAECVSGYGEVQFFIMQDNTIISDWHPHWKKLTISGEDYAALEPDAQLTVSWHHTQEMVNTIDQTPDIPLSAFSDRLIITVNYTDGSSEVFITDILFSDEGVATIEYKGSVLYSAENEM